MRAYTQYTPPIPRPDTAPPDPEPLNHRPIKLHTVRIVGRGGRGQIYVDGEQFCGVTDIVTEQSVGKTTKVTLTFLCHTLDIESEEAEAVTTAE